MGKLSFKDFSEILQSNGAENIGLLTVDLRSRIHLLTLPVAAVTEATLEEGIGFDASSFGFASTESSDMVMRPDLKAWFVDPFREKKTVNFLSTIHYIDKDRTRYEGDPRFIAEKAEASLKTRKIADASFWGPEYEFFVFDNAEFECRPEHTFFSLESGEESIYKSYHTALPEDKYCWFRDDVVSILDELKVPVKYHHHEVGQWGQQEIETRFEPLLKTCDNSVLIKYVIKNVAKSNDLAVTFMPKPIKIQAGSGWHYHQYLVKGGKNAFYQAGKYANLNETALFYIGGILSHLNSLVGITNPSTNSYKRLIPNFEAPTGINFGIGNRNSAIRIPGYVAREDETRVEFRTPDATCNPYLALSATLMAGIDGIVEKVDPIAKGYGPADPKKKYKEIEGNLQQALANLKKDKGFLLRDGVFSEVLVDKYIADRNKDCVEVSLYPTPAEYLYYFDI